MPRLVVVSNRPPDVGSGAARASVGGLESALLPAIEETGGLWLWDGQPSEQSRTVAVSRRGNTELGISTSSAPGALVALLGHVAFEVEALPQLDVAAGRVLVEA